MAVVFSAIFTKLVDIVHQTHYTIKSLEDSIHPFLEDFWYTSNTKRQLIEGISAKWSYERHE